MKKHKHAINNLRQKLVDLTEHKRHVKAQILALKHDESGQRRPETGPERSQLWWSYVLGERPIARLTHLALGLLRGRPYAAMESKATELPSIYGLLNVIHEALGDDGELKAEWTQERLKGLLNAASTARAAA